MTTYIQVYAMENFDGQRRVAGAENYRYYPQMEHGKNDNSQESHDELDPPMEVPPEAISSDALAGLIGEFILRDGTDYGLVEISHATKVEQIERQLNRGDIKIIFDPNLESVTLMTSKEWKKVQRSS